MHTGAVTSRVAALAAFLALASAPAAGAAEPLLPDLTQETPHELGVATDGQRFHLGFGSVIYNYGDGVLRVAGARESTSDPTMTATQLIDHTDGSRTRVEGVGEFRYVDSITHRHWHYLKASTYSLRRTDGSLARPDQKTGFCLGDRLRAPLLGPPPETEPPTAYSGIGCGYDEPDWLEIEEGIAPGHGDDYGPQLEGQFIDITKLRAGRYQLVHHVNPTGALREKSLDNNASSVLIDVRWRGGMPRVTQLSRCPGSGTCPVAPPLGRARATRLARAALREAFGVRRPRELVCPAGSAARVRCTWSRGAVSVGYSVARGRVYWSWRATARGRRSVSRRGEVNLGPARPVPVERAGSVARGKVGYCPLIERG
jgi:hypothetical protein